MKKYPTVLKKYMSICHPPKKCRKNSHISIPRRVLPHRNRRAPVRYGYD